MTLRILADENIPAVEHYAAGLGTVGRFSGRSLQPEQLAGVDVLLVRSVTRVDARLLDNSGVRFVGTATSGVDHIDRDYLRQRGIGFQYAPGSNANSVVEYVLAAIAAVPGHLERVLEGAPVGIIGFGVIGRAVAARLDALGINCCACDPWLDQATIDRPASLAQVLDCAVVTLHAELTDRDPWPSRHLLDRAALDRLGDTSLLINASRGPVVDNRALLALLARGNGPDTVLDVWEGEPAIEHELLRRVRYGTPHIAGYSLDGKLLATRMLVQAMALALRLDWLDPGSAAGEPAPLQIAPQETGAALLRSIISQRYDITADDAALREATLGLDAGAAAAGFDRLRREYPERREILGSRVSGQAAGAREQRLLAGLGCLAGSPAG
ncbi:MAG: 4-phosphoerythronate dehydrogenase [Halieaceae bacterium]|jgi:erythronate-4-phosphate dehydrogenase|nr:4-phosphoerythronate dehydrogenase [Halieaceae bacterium]